MRKTTAPKKATTPTIVVVVPLRICGSVGEKKTIDVEKWSVNKGGILQEKGKNRQLTLQTHPPLLDDPLTIPAWLH